MSENVANLAKALAAAQAKLKKAAKDSENPYFSSRYADLESVLDAMRQPFASEGLSIVQSVVGESMVTTILHASGESVSSSVPFILTKKDMQAVGSAITYARRYGLAAACGISQTDDDGNAAVEPPAPAPKVSQKKEENSATDAVKYCGGPKPAPKPEPKPEPKKEAESMFTKQEIAEDERALINKQGLGFTVGGSPGGWRKFNYDADRNLVVACATTLNIPAKKLTANREALKTYLELHASSKPEDIHDALKAFFEGRE